MSTTITSPESSTVVEVEGPFVLFRLSKFGRRGQWYVDVAQPDPAKPYRYATVAGSPRKATTFASIADAKAAPMSGDFSVRAMSAYNRR